VFDAYVEMIASRFEAKLHNEEERDDVEIR